MKPHRARSVGPVIVGSGVAGLSTALALDGCVVLTDGALGATGSTPLAQGGIAAAVGQADDPQRHRADTHAVGGGLTVDEVVAVVTEGGAAAVAGLIELGAEFD